MFVEMLKVTVLKSLYVYEWQKLLKLCEKNMAVMDPVIQAKAKLGHKVNYKL